jgi:2-keto-3-deoxy-L-fuconate dehydrogenase
MGPPIVELFRNEGATVIADVRDLRADEAADEAVRDAGELDVVIANLAEPPRMAATCDIRDEDWHALFDALVHPLMRITRAALPAMIERKSGKIVAITSAAPLRGLPKGAAYCAARGAQNAFVRAAGIESARHNVQINAVAQNYVENDTYYTKEMLADETLMARMKRAIPAGRLAKGSESAELALFLASDKSDFIVGQIIPFAGGWTTTTE